ncbi:MAG: saccharopine dehydrogenase NADP-binding domain-containing protein [Myxococcota bacterium]
MSSQGERLDIVVYGATGFAGELIARYLVERYADSDLRWALAGRRHEKLEAMRARLGAEIPIIVANSTDRESLDEMAAKTKVVLTTVGPYAKYGTELVSACIAQGTHYCDLTGELQFVRRMIDAHHEAAANAGVRIVHCCGFDSIPSDLGTWLLNDELIKLDGAPADAARYFMLGGNGGFSGGTVASLLNIIEEASDPLVRRVLGNPYSLNPDGERSGPDGQTQATVKKDPVTGWWSGPFLMAPINERVVRRSNALLDFRYGRQFEYGESVRTGSGVLGAIAAGALTAGMGAMFGAVAFAPTRRLLTNTILPAPGEGPSEKVMENGFFKVAISGRRDGREVGRVIVTSQRDPGYGATACMIAESALCLARDPLDTPGGILTPAAAMGGALIERLDRQDVQFHFEARTT